VIWVFLAALLWSQLSLGGTAQAASLPLTITFQSSSTPITFGETAILATDDGGNGNLLVSQNVSLAQSCQLQSLSFYVATAAGNLRLGVYDATGPSGGPGALVAQTASFAPTTGWNTQPTTAQSALTSGTYWLAYLPSSSSLRFRKATAAGTSVKYQSFTFGLMPATFPSGPFPDPKHVSLYATCLGGPPSPLTVSFNPPSPSIACEAAPGSVVSSLVPSGGNGNPITYSPLSGDTADFRLSSTSPPANVIVGPSGITPANCGTTSSVDVTATQ
jgi:hypothetical protein